MCNKEKLGSTYHRIQKMLFGDKRSRVCTISWRRNRMIYRCLCKAKKFMKLVLDGGSRGPYELDLCKTCFSNTRLKFVIDKRPICDP